MQYYTYELAHALMHPVRLMTRALKTQVEASFNPFAQTEIAKNISAACEVFEGMTRRYGKPEFGIKETKIHGLTVPVREEVVLQKPFCNLVHFDRDETVVGKRYDPKVLLIAPMSGHYATLLRGTVETMIPEHNLYITDWADARDIPAYAGSFDLDDFVDYIVEFIQFLGPNTHVIAVCQPAVPALAAAAVMAMDDDPCQPSSMTLMGGPIDTRQAPTEVNRYAMTRSLRWFDTHVITRVPLKYPGYMRRVYPGFLQHSGFVAMNPDRHLQAHIDFYQHLVEGDGDSAEAHRKFYDEYNAVMDLPAEYYLETLEMVFMKHQLPRGEMSIAGRRVRPWAIRDVALFTIEGELDDISGPGQTEAAHALCRNLPAERKRHFLVPGVGHYGIFSGRRWRETICPRVGEFIRDSA